VGVGVAVGVGVELADMVGDGAAVAVGVGVANPMVSVRVTGAAAKNRAEPRLLAVIEHMPSRMTLTRPNATVHTVRVLLVNVTSPAGALAESICGPSPTVMPFG
jgi:hypothetical protein